MEQPQSIVSNNKKPTKEERQKAICERREAKMKVKIERVKVRDERARLRLEKKSRI